MNLELEKIAISNKYLARVISRVSSPERLTEFSNNSLGKANALGQRIKQNQKLGNIPSLKNSIRTQNNRLSAAEMAANKSLNLSVRD